MGNQQSRSEAKEKKGSKERRPLGERRETGEPARTPAVTAPDATDHYCSSTDVYQRRLLGITPTDSEPRPDVHTTCGASGCGDVKTPVVRPAPKPAPRKTTPVPVPSVDINKATPTTRNAESVNEKPGGADKLSQGTCTAKLGTSEKQTLQRKTPVAVDGEVRQATEAKSDLIKKEIIQVDKPVDNAEIASLTAKVKTSGTTLLKSPIPKDRPDIGCRQLCVSKPIHVKTSINYESRQMSVSKPIDGKAGTNAESKKSSQVVPQRVEAVSAGKPEVVKKPPVEQPIRAVLPVEKLRSVVNADETVMCEKKAVEKIHSMGTKTKDESVDVEKAKPKLQVLNKNKNERRPVENTKAVSGDSEAGNHISKGSQQVHVHTARFVNPGVAKQVTPSNGENSVPSVGQQHTKINVHAKVSDDDEEGGEPSPVPSGMFAAMSMCMKNRLKQVTSSFTNKDKHNIEQHLHSNSSSKQIAHHKPAVHSKETPYIKQAFTRPVLVQVSSKKCQTDLTMFKKSDGLGRAPLTRELLAACAEEPLMRDFVRTKRTVYMTIGWTQTYYRKKHASTYIFFEPPGNMGLLTDEEKQGKPLSAHLGILTNTPAPSVQHSKESKHLPVAIDFIREKTKGVFKFVGGVGRDNDEKTKIPVHGSSPNRKKLTRNDSKSTDQQSVKIQVPELPKPIQAEPKKTDGSNIPETSKAETAVEKLEVHTIVQTPKTNMNPPKEVVNAAINQAKKDAIACLKKRAGASKKSGRISQNLKSVPSRDTRKTMVKITDSTILERVCGYCLKAYTDGDITLDFANLAEKDSSLRILNILSIRCHTWEMGTDMALVRALSYNMATRLEEIHDVGRSIMMSLLCAMYSVPNRDYRPADPPMDEVLEKKLACHRHVLTEITDLHRLIKHFIHPCSRTLTDDGYVRKNEEKKNMQMAVQVIIEGLTDGLTKMINMEESLEEYESRLQPEARCTVHQLLHTIRERLYAIDSCHKFVFCVKENVSIEDVVKLSSGLDEDLKVENGCLQQYVFTKEIRPSCPMIFKSNNPVVCNTEMKTLHELREKWVSTKDRVVYSRQPFPHRTEGLTSALLALYKEAVRQETRATIVKFGGQLCYTDSGSVIVIVNMQYPEMLESGLRKALKHASDDVIEYCLRDMDVLLPPTKVKRCDEWMLKMREFTGKLAENVKTQVVTNIPDDTTVSIELVEKDKEWYFQVSFHDESLKEVILPTHSGNSTKNTNSPKKHNNTGHKKDLTVQAKLQPRIHVDQTETEMKTDATKVAFMEVQQQPEAPEAQKHTPTTTPTKSKPEVYYDNFIAGHYDDYSIKGQKPTRGSIEYNINTKKRRNCSTGIGLTTRIPGSSQHVLKPQKHKTSKGGKKQFKVKSSRWENIVDTKAAVESNIGDWKQHNSKKGKKKHERCRASAPSKEAEPKKSPPPKAGDKCTEPVKLNGPHQDVRTPLQRDLAAISMGHKDTAQPSSKMDDRHIHCEHFAIHKKGSEDTEMVPMEALKSVMPGHILDQ